MTTALALLAVAAFQAPAASNVMLKERNLSCADWARVANYYVELGEEKAAADLIERTSPNPKKFAISNTHACHIARLIYEAKSGQPLRPPRLGAATLADGTSSGYEGWPCFPFAYQNGAWFLIADGYQLAGLQETVGNYLAYLKKEGRFRKILYPVPTAKQAEAAYERLVLDKRWQARTLNRNFLKRQTVY